MRSLLLLATVCLGAAVSAAARAEIAVVVNPDSGVTQMTREQVVNIYMGRYQGLPSGITAFPVDLAPLRETFYRELVGRTTAEINSYWARLVFSGRATPPRRLDEAAAVLEVVSNNRGAIGYLPGEAADDERVTVVLMLDD